MTQIKINAKTFFAQIPKCRVKKMLGNYLSFTSAADVARRAEKEHISFSRYRDSGYWVYVIRTEWAEAHFYHGVAGLLSGKSFVKFLYVVTQYNRTRSASNPFERKMAENYLYVSELENGGRWYVWAENINKVI